MEENVFDSVVAMAAGLLPNRNTSQIQDRLGDV